MGIMNLIKASWTGKVGQTVGAKWKSKATIRAYTIPSYSDTPAQQTIRSGFRDLTKYFSLMAPQLKPYTALDVRSMSVRNALLKLNKDEIIAGAIDIPSLKLSRGGLPTLTGTSAAPGTDEVTFKWTAATSPIITTKAQVICVWYNKAGNNCLVGHALNTAGTLVMTGTTGAAAQDDAWLYLIDYRGSAKVGSQSVHVVVT